jgi:pimeloyl-ACP methyl ester carboxylesterase
MRKTFLSVLLIIFTGSVSSAQSNGIISDSAKSNNLILPLEYKCSVMGAIPEYSKAGNGSPSLIVIPGLGFDKSIFGDFIKANQRQYTIYCITIPGYGNTQAPALPPVGTSFGEQSWNKSILEGIKMLISQEKIRKPIIVGHFVQGTQLALRMAIDFPELVSGVIILGGPAKFILISNGKPVEYPLASTVNYIDKITAPNWFKSISKSDYDNGNYLPEIYSLDSGIANSLWKQSASVPLPVAVHSLCEFLASDITLEAEKIKCPVLVLRPAFNDKVLRKTINNYLVPQFINAWDKVKNTNALFQITDIPNASTCLWKDNPKYVNKQINIFIKSIKKSN